MDSTSHQFHLADYLVFGVTIVACLGIGIYYALSGGRQRTTREFLLADKSMSCLPVAISLFVSFESSIMMLGLPAEGYAYGAEFALSFIPYFLCTMLSAYIAVPLMYPLKVTSSYEYLGMRFNRTVQLLGSTMGVVYDIAYIGIVLYGPALALQAVAGFPLWLSIGGLASLSVVYTAIGGLKAVIWTDVFQTVIMFTGIFAVLIKGTMSVGGPSNVWDIADKGGRLHFLTFDPDPRTRHTVWSMLASGICRGFICFRQSTVQRLSSTNSMQQAKRVLIFVGPMSFIVSILAIYEGIVSYAYFANKECDPFESGRIENLNQIIPYTVMELFQSLSGMPGLFLASLFSASLSTLSSSLSSLSALLWTDFIHPVVGEVKEWKATLIAKMTVVVCGVLGCGLAFVISLIGGTLYQISVVVLSAVQAPYIGIFFLGCFCPRSTSKGATIGGLLGFVIAIWLCVGSSFTPGLKKAPFLPPASTANCGPMDTMHWLANGTNGNVSLAISVNQTTELIDVMTNVTTTGACASSSVHGIEHIYSISYLLISPICIVITVLFGYIASLATGPNKPGDVEPRYILAVSDSLLVWLPKPIRRYIGSKGTQFINLDSTSTNGGPIPEKGTIDNEIEATPLFVTSDLSTTKPRDFNNGHDETILIR